jgi:ADP-ribose pyrophosphatase YjhB (NUDIX family)
MGRKPGAELTTLRPAPTHVTLAVVLQVREGTLQVLLWERARDPFAGAWSLPGGYLHPGETLEESIRTHLAEKVDVRELSHLEQLETRGDPDRSPHEWQLATAYLGLVPSGVDPELPDDTAWHRVDALPAMAFDHGPITRDGRERLRAKLSYSNIGFALAPEEFTLSELRDLYAAALGHDVSATNLQRVLLRRSVLEPTGSRRASGPTGGRPGALFRFCHRGLEITDQFAVLRPPDR